MSHINQSIMLPDGKMVRINLPNQKQNPNRQSTSRQVLNSILKVDKPPNETQTADTFDGNFYVKAYKDIKSGNDIYNHYQLHGRREKRLCSQEMFYSLYPNFSREIYLEHNTDLANLSLEELLSHFHHHGRGEGRIYQMSNSNLGVHNYEIVDNGLKSKESNQKFKNQVQEQLREYSGRKYLEHETLKLIDVSAVNSVAEIRIDDKLRQIIDKHRQMENKKPIYLVTAEWGYPPFGGGECWLMDTMKWLSEQGFSCYYIYFYDAIKKQNFDQINLIDIGYGTFIQFTQNYLELFQFIRRLNPKVISHQGLNRLKFMKIANLLEKPFVTGFCFWQDIIKMNAKYQPNDPYNRNMMNKMLPPDPNFKAICNEASYPYVCGQFVNDVIKKVHNLNLDVINTIADESHYKIDRPEIMDCHYVVVINVCGLKGGLILEQIINNVDTKVPFMLIDSQDSENPDHLKLEKMIRLRNQTEKTNKSMYIKGAISDIKSIYRQARILLVPSLVDETFCRVAYEGMMNHIPIISTTNGNLKYLLKNYADFLGENPEHWSRKINEIYDNADYLVSMQERPKPINSSACKNKFIEQIYRCITNHSNEQKDYKNLGIFCPWGDQGLGIQCREYYDIFRKLGYTVNIFSFKPYNSTAENPRLQSNPLEWDYANIHYSSNTRESVAIDEVIDFIYRYKVKKMIIVETCYPKVFEVAQICRLFSVEVYSIPNLETLRYSEIAKHNVFDKIICNNQMTYDILSTYFPKKTDILGFRILNKSFSTSTEKKWNKNYHSFFCCGGMNALTRKNIDKIAIAFKEIENEKKHGNFRLYIYIQGVEIPQNYKKYASENIIISIGSRSYQEIAQLYKKHDIFVHMGDHEGLGLGLYESIACGTPVLTIDTPPNNEIIKSGKNGWVIPCAYEKLNDNPDGIVKKALIQSKDIKAQMLNIISHYNRKTMYDLTINDYLTRYPIHQYTETIKKIFE